MVMQRKVAEKMDLEKDGYKIIYIDGVTLKGFDQLDLVVIPIAA